MAYIRTREAEILVRRLFRERATLSLGEILCAGLELGPNGFAGSDEAPPWERRDNGWEKRFENAVNVTFGSYLRAGHVWPVKWRTYLRHVVAAAHESEREDCEELGVAGVDVPRIQSRAAVEAALRAVEGRLVPWLTNGQVFAGAARRALAGWTKPTPPWSGQGALIERNVDWRACQCILVSIAFPHREYDNSRKVRWMAGKSLFRTPFISGIDLLVIHKRRRLVED